jgi:hypothetical protein
MPKRVEQFDAILFDMDGTLLKSVSFALPLSFRPTLASLLARTAVPNVRKSTPDHPSFDFDHAYDSSTPAVNGVWQEFAKKYDLDLDELLTSWVSPPSVASPRTAATANEADEGPLMLVESHGVQTHMTFAKYLPQLSPEERFVHPRLPSFPPVSARLGDSTGPRDTSPRTYEEAVLSLFSVCCPAQTIPKQSSGRQGVRGRHHPNRCSSRLRGESGLDECYLQN